MILNFIVINVFLFDEMLLHNKNFKIQIYKAVSISLPMLVIVAELTQKSLGVGYDIGRAVAINKLVICLFRSDSGKSKSLKIAFACLKLHFSIKWC